MARPDRLFRLLDLLRRLPQPVTAARLAEATSVSERTLYRDIETLRAGGALIDGAAGFGYTLTEDSALPPQMFTRLEVEALVLGLAEVQMAGDTALAEASRTALAKITATLPERVQRQALHAVQKTYRFERRPPAPESLSLIREACWEEEVIAFTYTDQTGVETRRQVWPLSVVFLDRTLMVLAWCCLRQGFRRFHLHRIAGAARTGGSFRPRRVPLLRAFLAQLRDEGEATRQRKRAQGD
ncbi:YafY family protein [Pseudorhodobacter sp.]|uniref:helix-turn-helix transcriptional regulator n=1 Tax=Pseudorhodobacter sp. TaxID=1934400 RepID=UPI0026485573|nr:YafY family protein [Pseudorhodobacter sp.]MDN5786220.1 YafY family transcriptional regulator [Pseudorhodobacter sp.]